METVHVALENLHKIKEKGVQEFQSNQNAKSL